MWTPGSNCICVERVNVCRWFGIIAFCDSRPLLHPLVNSGILMFTGGLEKPERVNVYRWFGKPLYVQKGLANVYRWFGKTLYIAYVQKGLMFTGGLEKPYVQKGLIFTGGLDIVYVQERVNVYRWLGKTSS